MRARRMRVHSTRGEERDPAMEPTSPYTVPARRTRILRREGAWLGARGIESTRNAVERERRRKAPRESQRENGMERTCVGVADRVIALAGGGALIGSRRQRDEKAPLRARDEARRSGGRAMRFMSRASAVRKHRPGRHLRRKERRRRGTTPRRMAHDARRCAASRAPRKPATAPALAALERIYSPALLLREKVGSTLPTGSLTMQAPLRARRARARLTRPRM